MSSPWLEPIDLNGNGVICSTTPHGDGHASGKNGRGGTEIANGPNDDYSHHFHPVAPAGYSIYIHHIELDEANRVRRQPGMPMLTEG